LLRALVPEREVILTGIDFELAKSPAVNIGEPDRIAVIASDNALNIHGLHAFLNECWPRIKDAHANTSLHVVGKVGDKCRIDDPTIQYSPWVADLDQVYSDARVIINPTVAGTGLKIKSVQALAHGKPLVAWTSGVEGLHYVGEPPYIECRSWNEFAAAVVRLLRSESEAQALAKRALSYAQGEFSSNHVYASLRACLAEHSLSRDAGRGERETDRLARTYQDPAPL
jgi:glycosyltransferase involved in cell wall biosynthesis